MARQYPPDFGLTSLETFPNRMNHTGYFLLPDGRLRAGWRLLIFVIFWVVIVNLLGWWLLEYSRHGQPVLAPLIHLASTAFVTWAMLKIFDCRPFADVGLGLDKGWWQLLGCGKLVGLATVAAVSVSLLGIADVQVTSVKSVNSSPMLAILTTTFLLVLAACFEELLFRGYPFQRLVEGIGATGAVLVSSTFFGIVHWTNPSASLLSTTNTVLAGVVLALGYLRTQSLWYPIGWHVAWNWSLGLAGFPVSGLDLFDVPWSAAGPPATAWLHGWEYGPEGGAVATVVLIGMAAMLWRCPGKVGCPSSPNRY